MDSTLGAFLRVFNIGKVRDEQERLNAEVIALRADNARLKQGNIELTNSEQMAVGAKDVLSKQITLRCASPDAP